MAPRAPKIGEYALLGNGRSAALVSREGSVDWLCWPRFDSPSVFGRLLGRDAGHFEVKPVGIRKIVRRYLPGTAVLQTRFFTDTGILRLTDLMPVASEPEKRHQLLPEHELLRVALCEEGQVELSVRYCPRPAYGRLRPGLIDRGALGIRCEPGGALLTLVTDLPLRIDEDQAHGRVRMRAGERRCLALTWAMEGPSVLPVLGEPSVQAIARTVRWWRGWTGALTYEGPAREAVVRSAITLKMLVYAPSGAVVAAPTTSLPERLGGDLNWDYRYCWLRDASLTFRALAGLGCRSEADAFVSWLLHSTALTQPELRILYDVFGTRPRPERTLDHLEGYRGSVPVRIGNAAESQLQLDTYGEVIDAAARWLTDGQTLDRDAARLLEGLLVRMGRFVCDHWHLPDAGIWEIRGPPRHHTHARLLCWTALDRLIALHEAGVLRGAPVARFRQHRQRIRTQIEARGYHLGIQSYTAVLGGETLDASLLRLPWYGFLPADAPRMRSTWRRMQQRLGAGGPLLWRSETLPSEGAFGICSFWGAEHLALGGGSVKQATEAFTTLIRYANDLGLFAEEIQPSDGQPLGNFPQAYTHVGLINAALTLQRRIQAEGRGRRR